MNDYKSKLVVLIFGGVSVLVAKLIHKRLARQFKTEDSPSKSGFFSKSFAVQPIKVLESVFSSSSAHQHLLCFKTETDELGIAIDSKLTFYQRDDVVFNELIAHACILLQHKPSRILIASLTNCGILREFCKLEQVKKIDICERDEMVLRVIEAYIPSASTWLDCDNVQFNLCPIETFIESKKNMYDVIILNDLSDFALYRTTDIGNNIKHNIRSNHHGSNSSEALYRKIYEALSDNGISVIPAGDIWFSMDKVVEEYEIIQRIFDDIKIAVVNTICFGWLCVLICIKCERNKVDQTENIENAFAIPTDENSVTVEGAIKYLSELERIFCLPDNLKRKLNL